MQSGDFGRNREMMTFNLIDQPWILVVSQDWQRRDISLTELFETWETLREIQADNPPTTLAIYRFLLAILHRAYQGPKNVDHWEEIQQDDGKKAIAYLNQWRDRFDLFHPEFPFMQDGTIDEKDSGEVYLASLLHGNNTSTVFCHEHQWSSAVLTIPEAARLVLRLYNFDTGGRKTGATDSAAVLPMMDAANVLVRGNSLCKTLLLNLVEYDPAREKPSPVTGDDLPAWERQYQKAKERIPVGYIDYLTYQWRRVKLFVQDRQVVKVALHPGDRIPKDISASQWECGIAYTKTPKGLMTVRLNRTRSLWRDSAVFLQSAETSSRPRILDWVAILKSEEGLIESNLHLQILGLNVDNAKPLGWSAQQFATPLIYLTDKPLWQNLSLAISTAEDHQQIFRSFQGSPYQALAKALNNNDAGSFAATLDGESRYWAMLDRAFQELLQALPQDKTEDGNGITYGNARLPEWTKTVQKAARDAFTESIASIRNYEARAKALHALEWKLFDLRSSPEQKAERKAKAAKKKEKVSKLGVRVMSTIQSRNRLERETRFLQSVNDRATKDNGAKADFKRALSGEPEHIRKVYPFVLPYVGTISEWEQERIWIPIACLSVYYPQPLRESEQQRNFGNSSRSLATNSEGTNRRFRALLDLALTDIHSPLTALVRQMKSKGIAIDYPKLIADLRQWERADQYIQDQWARAFWDGVSSDPSQEEQAMSE